MTRKKNPNSKTKFFTIRVNPTLFERIERNWKDNGFPSRQAWGEKAIQYFLGDC